MESLPPLSADLVEQLPNVFPKADSATLLAFAADPVKLGAYIGEQRVIEFLQMRLQQTKDEQLNV